jgi:hypothetical protein
MICLDALASLDAEATDADRLKQSILKAACEGRLVPQDPSDEPASALVARLAALPTPGRQAGLPPAGCQTLIGVADAIHGMISSSRAIP